MKWSLSVVVFALISAPFLAQAATLNVLPASITVNAGESVTMTVTLSSDQAVNALSGTLTFPTSLLSVVSVSKSGSVVSLWVQDPTYSNSDGTVDFSGAIPNPGYSGSGGKVVTVRFKAKQSGSALLSLVSSQVLANDGAGTNILSGTRGATVTINETPAAPPAVQPQTTQTTPVVPVATSTTEPTTTPIEVSGPVQPVVVYPPWWSGLFSTDALWKIGWRAVNYLSAVILIASIIGAVLFVPWYLWHRAHHVRRKLLRHIAATDKALHADLLEVHKALKEEVERLEAESKARQLTSEEKRVLKKFSKLAEKTGSSVMRGLYD